MTNKIELDSVESGYGLSKINDNFQKIEDELNNRVLYRDNTNGAPNAMDNPLDMNGERIYNLPRPSSASEPLRLIDAAEIAAGGEFPINLTISSSGTGESLVNDPAGVVRSIEGVGLITTTVVGGTVEISTTAQNNTATNLGTGTGVYASKDGSSLRFKSLKAGTNITLSENGSEITIASAGGTGAGEANTASNVGTGSGVFKTKSGVDLQFKSLKAGTNVILTSGTDDITISASGGGGGGTWDGFADVTDFGAVSDFVSGPAGTGSGTANDAAFMAAIATGKPLYIPAGNFYIADWATRYAYSRSTVHSNSTGIVWGDTWSGKQQLGRTIFVGCASTHEVSYAGGVMWGQNGNSNGIRQWTGFNNWMMLQPDTGPMQLQLYPGGKGLSITASCESPNKLNAVYGTFDTSLLRAGMHVGWNGVVYKVASVISSTQITVTTFAGASPAFTTNTTQRPFYCYYEYSRFVGNVSGSTVTRVSGDAIPYGTSNDHMICVVNGTAYNVSQGPESTGSPHTVTLATSPGSLTNVNCEFYRTYGPWSYVTLFRLQGVSGGTETNGGIALNIKNELRIWNGGTHGELYGPIKLNAIKTVIGPGDGSTDDELIEVGNTYVTIGGRPGQTNRNWFEMDSLGNAIAPILKAEGPGTNIPMALAGKGNSGIQFGISANKILAFDAASGFAPAFATRGNDANPDMGFDLQGTGTFRFTAGTFGRTTAEIYAPSGSNSWAALTPGSGVATYGVNSTGANADLVVTPKGSGKLLLKGIPYLLLRRTSALSLAPNAGTTVSWDAEDVDTHGMHTAGSSTVTAAVAGLYNFQSGFNVEGLSTTASLVVTGVYLIVNGTAVRSTPFTRHRVPNGVASTVGSAMNIDYYLFAGDTVQIQFYYGTDSGASAGINTSFNYNYFNMRLVAP